MSIIGFLGLGNMGGPMAANLAGAGHRVIGFDLMSQALEEARRAGVEVAGAMEDVALHAEFVITMLPSGRHVVDVYRSSLMTNASPGTTFLDCSTIDVASARLAHDLANEHGMKSVDAPVSGGTSGAANGTLTFMVGGAPETVESVRPILSVMGKKIVSCGPAGTGQAAKICNNLVLGSSMVAASEAFILGQALGITSQALFDVMSTSSAQCWSINTYCPVPGPVPSSPANRDYEPGFSTKLMLKDLNLAREAAAAVGVTLPLGSHARDLYQAYDEANGGHKDFSGVINFLRSEDK